MSIEKQGLEMLVLQLIENSGSEGPTIAFQRDADCVLIGLYCPAYQSD